MERKLYVAWQDTRPKTRRWYTVGVLTHSAETDYVFRYVRGANEARVEGGFFGIASFPEFEAEYRSESLFSFFSNRLLSSDRPAYKELIEQVGLQEAGDYESPDHIFEFLRRTRGWRATDSFEMFSPVEKKGEVYYWDFFTRGLRYTDPGVQQRWTEEGPKLPLRMLPDMHNKIDPTAVLIVDDFQRSLGFVPGNYSATIFELVSHAPQGEIELKVIRQNRAERLHQQRFLLEMKVRMPVDFELTVPEELEPLVDLKESVA